MLKPGEKSCRIVRKLAPPFDHFRQAGVGFCLFEAARIRLDRFNFPNAIGAGLGKAGCCRKQQSGNQSACHYEGRWAGQNCHRWMDYTDLVNIRETLGRERQDKGTIWVLDGDC